MLKVFCKNNGTYKEFQEGTTLLEMLPSFDFDKPYDIVSAKVNNVCEGLKFRVFNSRDVEFLDYRSYNGRNVYCRSLCFLLYKAAKELFPNCKIILRRPISKGIYLCNNRKFVFRPHPRSKNQAVSRTGNSAKPLVERTNSIDVRGTIRKINFGFKAANRRRRKSGTSG